MVLVVVVFGVLVFFMFPLFFLFVLLVVLRLVMVFVFVMGFLSFRCGRRPWWHDGIVAMALFEGHVWFVVRHRVVYVSFKENYLGEVFSISLKKSRPLPAICSQ